MDENLGVTPNPTPDLDGVAGTPPEPTKEETVDSEALKAEIERLKAESAKHKAAFDKASSEAASWKKQARSLQTEDERRKAEQEESTAALQAELEALRKQNAVANISRQIMSFIGDEKTATTVAESLYGATNIDAAVDAIGKAWALKEKQLRLEYSKISAPGAGESNDDPQSANIELAAKMGKARAAAMQGNNGLQNWVVH